MASRQWQSRSALAWTAAIFFGVIVAVGLLFFDPLWAIAAAVLPLLCFLWLRYPFTAVLACLAALIIQPEQLRHTYGLNLEKTLALTAVVAVLLPQVAQRRWQPWRWVVTDRAVVLLILAGCVALIFSPWREWASAGCYQLARLGFFYAAIRYTAVSVRRLRAVVWTMLLATVFSGSMALYMRLAGDVKIGEYGVVRASGPTSTTGDPNALACALVAMLPFAVLLVAAAHHTLAKVVHAAVGGFFLYVAALTGGRHAIVSLMAIVPVMIVQSRRRILGVVVTVACLAAVWSLIPPDLQERYLTLRTYRGEATYQDRLHHLRIGLMMLRERPLTGWGVACFARARAERYDGVWMDAHNLLAQVGGEMGVPGVAAFAFLLWASLSSAWRARRALLSLRPGLDADQIWLERLCVAVIVMFAALLVQAIATHSLLRWQFYGGAALAANSFALAQDATRGMAETGSVS